MRPVDKGDSPVDGDFDNYRDAFPDLQSRLGPYCSYCERRIPTQLAVEHIQPKDLYPHIEGAWANFLLGCVNCNSTKLVKDVALDDWLLPDRDNTMAAFAYTSDGKVHVRVGLGAAAAALARTTLATPGLDKPLEDIRDANGSMVAKDRVAQRMETWLVAESSKIDLEANPHDAMRRAIVRTALVSGFFSIWMTVFEDDPAMRQLFIDAFPGTSRVCFDEATTRVRTPRPPNALASSGKL